MRRQVARDFVLRSPEKRSRITVTGYTALVRATRDGRPLAALLLDLDDTILDDGAGFEEAWAHAADLLVKGHPGLERSEVVAEIDRARSWFWDDPARHRRGRLDLVAARAEILAAALDRLGRPAPGLAREAGEAYTDLRDRHQRFLPGARAAVMRLRTLVPAMALVTNGASRPQRAKIARFDLEPHFDHIQVEGEFGVGKPEPVVYEHVLASLGVRADDCVMVGDNFQADVLGAQAVGIHAVWMDVRRRGVPAGTAAKPHWTVQSLEELIALLLPPR
jgi:putative hydrolase of the HAD superfamily